MFTLFAVAFFVLKVMGYLASWSYWWLLPILLGDFIILGIVLAVFWATDLMK